ncbi:hypothetical protein [Neorhizobium alkalisoli]|uniref:Uncharacterized protein n=1 Tax=Neorhizobium alkalisoli TaxID=528178 RepID=A0A561QH24_9HYPH|nr:hypothetical protein [Neorhizobium alkalisoli]TWF49649.1 hypothetical protein FHW37_10715 [Neorhizobium alkalisoli]
MTIRNLSTAVLSAFAGGFITVAVMSHWLPVSTAKSDRLGGPTTETAFLPERFGVPAASPTIK